MRTNISTRRWRLICQVGWGWKITASRYLHQAEGPPETACQELPAWRAVTDRQHSLRRFVGHLRADEAETLKRGSVYSRPSHIYSIWRKIQKELAFK